MQRPLIGITTDNGADPARPLYTCREAYAQAVTRAGGLPLLLAQDVELVDDYLDRCDGFVLTGGHDPHMEAFGRITHHCANRVAPRRQAFECALIEAAAVRRPDLPILGICFGMQLMALRAGGDLHQHLPELLLNSDLHRGDHRHTIVVATDSQLAAAAQHDDDTSRPAGSNSPIPGRVGLAAHLVASWHHQAVRDAGTLRVSGRAPDGVIEAVEDPTRRFYLGVQWHPERSGAGPLGTSLFSALVAAAALSTSPAA